MPTLSGCSKYIAPTLAMTAEVVSVRPYPFAGDTLRSKSDSILVIRSGGTGAPPDAMPASEESSRLARPGDSSRRRTSVGTIAAAVTCSVSMSLTASSVSHLYIRTSLPPKPV